MNGCKGGFNFEVLSMASAAESHHRMSLTTLGITFTASCRPVPLWSAAGAGCTAVVRSPITRHLLSQFAMYVQVRLDFETLRSH